MSVYDIAELRDLLRQSADQRTPSEWWLLALADSKLASELVALLELAESGTSARRFVAEGLRFRVGLVAAYALETLDALETQEHLSGPIGEETMSSAEAAEAVELLVAAARGDER